MAHWTFDPYGEGFSWRFASKALAERFSCYWPGYLGKPVAIKESPSQPPVWDVLPDRYGADIALAVENRHELIRFP